MQRCEGGSCCSRYYCAKPENALPVFARVKPLDGYCARNRRNCRKSTGHKPSDIQLQGMPEDVAQASYRLRDVRSHAVAFCYYASRQFQGCERLDDQRRKGQEKRQAERDCEGPPRPVTVDQKNGGEGQADLRLEKQNGQSSHAQRSAIFRDAIEQHSDTEIDQQ